MVEIPQHVMLVYPPFPKAWRLQSRKLVVFAHRPVDLNPEEIYQKGSN